MDSKEDVISVAYAGKSTLPTSAVPVTPSVSKAVPSPFEVATIVAIKCPIPVI